MANLLLNKPATANNSFAPFLPSRAVDGNTTDPKSRWVCSQLPGWLCVDMQNNYFINQWNASFMGSAGWAANYNLCDFKLQGSLDNVNWFNMDTVTGNTANQINRSFNPILARYLRVSITKGLAVNNQVSSIVDFQASESANTPFLSNLVPGAGSLNPGFATRTFNYTIAVTNTVSSITFTPTALQTNMEIKVNGTVVASGTQSGQITLAIGNNSIPITVKSADGTILTSYNIIVTRASGAAYLESLAVTNNRSQPVALTPSFVKETLNYTASQGSGIASVTIKPTSVDSSATILVNGILVPSRSTSGAIPLQTGQNTITIVVNSITTYYINIMKG